MNTQLYCTHLRLKQCFLLLLCSNSETAAVIPACHQVSLFLLTAKPQSFNSFSVQKKESLNDFPGFTAHLWVCRSASAEQQHGLH